MEIEQKSYDLSKPKRIFYVAIVSQHIGNILMLSTKLPNETVDERFNKPMGTTYADIQKVYADAVDSFEGIISPIIKDWKMVMNAENEKAIKEGTGNIVKTDFIGTGSTPFENAKQKFAWLVQVLDDLDYLRETYETRIPLVREGEVMTEEETAEAKKIYWPEKEEVKPNGEATDTSGNGPVQSSPGVLSATPTVNEGSNRLNLLEAEANQSDV